MSSAFHVEHVYRCTNSQTLELDQRTRIFHLSRLPPNALHCQMPNHYLARTTIQGTGNVHCATRCHSANLYRCCPSPDRPTVEHPWCPIFNHAQTTSIRSGPMRGSTNIWINPDHVNTRWQSHQTRPRCPNQATCLPWPASPDQPRPSQDLLEPCLPPSRRSLLPITQHII